MKERESKTKGRPSVRPTSLVFHPPPSRPPSPSVAAKDSDCSYVRTCTYVVREEDEDSLFFTNTEEEGEEGRS